MRELPLKLLFLCLAFFNIPHLYPGINHSFRQYVKSCTKEKILFGTAAITILFSVMVVLIKKIKLKNTFEPTVPPVQIQQSQSIDQTEQNEDKGLSVKELLKSKTIVSAYSLLHFILENLKGNDDIALFLREVKSMFCSQEDQEDQEDNMQINSKTMYSQLFAECCNILLQPETLTKLIKKNDNTKLTLNNLFTYLMELYYNHDSFWSDSIFLKNTLMLPALSNIKQIIHTENNQEWYHQTQREAALFIIDAFTRLLEDQNDFEFHIFGYDEYTYQNCITVVRAADPLMKGILALVQCAQKDQNEYIKKIVAAIEKSILKYNSQCESESSDVKIQYCSRMLQSGFFESLSHEDLYNLLYKTIGDIGSIHFLKELLFNQRLENFEKFKQGIDFFEIIVAANNRFKDAEKIRNNRVYCFDGTVMPKTYKLLYQILNIALTDPILTERLDCAFTRDNFSLNDLQEQDNVQKLFQPFRYFCTEFVQWRKKRNQPITYQEACRVRSKMRSLFEGMCCCYYDGVRLYNRVCHYHDHNDFPYDGAFDNREKQLNKNKLDMSRFIHQFIFKIHCQAITKLRPYYPETYQFVMDCALAVQNIKD